MNVSIALIVHRAIRYPEGAFGRLLNLPPLVYLGTLSYSLYLWQQIFLDRSDPRPLAAFPLNLGLALCCALPSFYLVEKPVLRWREALEPKLFARKAGKAPQII
jgi:peptidoglycan/LPS O-acetylase OafA/YrhL